jgi:hypothetical protein
MVQLVTENNNFWLLLLLLLLLLVSAVTASAAAACCCQDRHDGCVGSKACGEQQCVLGALELC